MRLTRQGYADRMLEHLRRYPHLRFQCSQLLRACGLANYGTAMQVLADLREHELVLRIEDHDEDRKPGVWWQLGSASPPARQPGPQQAGERWAGADALAAR